jgi:hypothetical protein
MNNNPVVFVDPTGHMADRGGGASSMGDDWWKKRQDKTPKPFKPPFDATLGGNNKKFNQETSFSSSEGKQINPPIGVLVTTGLLLTGASLVAESAIIITEVVILPTTAVAPPVSLGLELTIGAAGLVILDVNISYWAYTARVINEPEVKQNLELLPPWGLDK